MPADQVEDVLVRVRGCVKWAAVRLDMGMASNEEPLKYARQTVCDARFATAYPSGSPISIARIEMRAKGEEPSNRLFSAMNEGAANAAVSGSAADKIAAVACEFFAAADFEITANSKFLMLCTALEVLADPQPRPALCVYLVEELVANVKKAQDVAKRLGDGEMTEALEGLQKSVVHYEKESITSSIRKLGTTTAGTLGDPDPEKVGRRAAELYGKRSELVHKGRSVGFVDLAELRKLVREMLAVRLGLYDRIRERYPA